MRSARFVRIGLVTLVMSSWMVASASAGGGPSTWPSHRIFVTSIAYDGNLGGLVGADAKCNVLAGAGSLTDPLDYTWRALLSVNGVVNARDRFVWLGPLVDVDGALVTNDPGTWPWSDDGSSEIDVDENGDPPPDAFAWSGSDITGVSVGANLDCNGWTTNSDEVDGWAGQTGNFPFEDWFDSFSSGCGDQWYSIYCVSDAQIFVNGFESGQTCIWSENQGSPDICA